jgi:hypothetical protein
MAEAAHAGGPSITLDATEKRLRPDKATDFSGTLSGVFSGDSGKTVTLYASPYPYETEEPVGTATTAAGGTFSFTNYAPELNTRYRVAFDGDILDGDASSNPVQIYVFAHFEVNIQPTVDFNKILATFDSSYSSQVQPEYLVGRTVFWYFKKKQQKFFKRVEKSKWQDTSYGAHAQATIKLPRSRHGYRYSIRACTEVADEDIGLGPPVEVNCPKRPRSARALRATPSSAPALSATRR